MTAKEMTQVDGSEKLTIDWKVIIGRFVFTIVFMSGILFLSAGRLDWWEGWAYLVLTLAVLIISRIGLILKYPDVAVERMAAGKKENVKQWDKIIVPLIAMYLPMISWIVGGLDARFEWSPNLPDGLQVIAFVVNFAASMFGTWAMFENKFFSSHVRIQTDRGHTVISSGPYRFVRHPGYTGGLVSYLTGPFIFSSRWVWVPTVLMIVLLVYRTIMEDRTLQEELSGYKEYAQKVRYRLLPGIW